jgi:hypothetical protein
MNLRERGRVEQRSAGPRTKVPDGSDIEEVPFLGYCNEDDRAAESGAGEQRSPRLITIGREAGIATPSPGHRTDPAAGATDSWRGTSSSARARMSLFSSSSSSWRRVRRPRELATHGDLRSRRLPLHITPPRAGHPSGP